MSSIIVDASVVLTLIRGESRAPEVRRAAEQWSRRRARLMAPAHMWLEVANALARRHAYPGARILEAVGMIDDLQVERVGVDDALVLGVIDMLERHGLSAYDAAYLALADALDGDLATFDGRLALAAGSRAYRWEGGPLRPSEATAPYAAGPTWPRWPGAAAHIAGIRHKLLAEMDGQRGPARRTPPR